MRFGASTNQGNCAEPFDLDEFWSWFRVELVSMGKL